MSNITLRKVISKCGTTVNETVKSKSVNYNNVDINFWKNSTIFCNYQIKMVLDDSPVTIVEKGRQIGASYTYAFRATLKAADDKRDSIVTSYNKASAKQFIKDCCHWARLFNQCFKLITYTEIVNEKDLNIYEVRFINGRTIIGLAGDSVNLRSYSGRDIYIDEACYRTDSLDDILAAALAAIIHSGTIRVLSTHAGTNSDFNNLIKSIKAGGMPYNLMTIPFKEAVADGLYIRICSKKGQEWSQELENAWIDSLYKLYGLRATEELDAVPSDYSIGGKIFYDFKYFDMSNIKPYEIIKFRYHDLADRKSVV